MAAPYIVGNFSRHSPMRRSRLHAALAGLVEGSFVIGRSTAGAQYRMYRSYAFVPLA